MRERGRQMEAVRRARQKGTVVVTVLGLDSRQVDSRQVPIPLG